MEKEIRTKTYIEQVKDGIVYKGSIDFDNYRFFYNLSFGVPIYDFDNVDSEKAISQIQLEIKDSKGNLLRLDDKIKEIFIGLCSSLAIELYSQPQVRDLNKGIGPGTDLEGRLSRMIFKGTSLGKGTMGITREYKTLKIRELEEFLKTFN